MKASQRRESILELLKATHHPISASQLAQQLQVSRQVIVGDVALLRAGSHDIIATPKGYLLTQPLSTHFFKGKIVCCHQAEETEEELLLIVRNGGMILDVEIEHPVYGMLTAALNIKTEEDVADFIHKINDSQASLLSALTQGIHLHTISCPSSHIFKEIQQQLAKHDYLYQEE